MTEQEDHRPDPEGDRGAHWSVGGAFYIGAAAGRHAAAWKRYDETGDVEVSHEAGVWARPDDEEQA